MVEYTHISDILQSLGIRLESTAPGWHSALCPKCSHHRRGERKNHTCLSIRIESDGVGVNCHNCTWKEVFLLNGKGNSHDRELTPYIYRDADGVERFRKVRNLPGREPRFWLEQPDGRGGWKKGTRDAKGNKVVNDTILYRADDVAKAIAQDKIIAVVEGEKDSNNCWRIGIAATCNAHGAAATRDKDGKPVKKYTPKWYKAHAEQLKDADVVVLCDHDEPGYKHAETAAKSLLGIAKRVRVLKLSEHWPECPEGGDVSDWLEKGGGTKEKLEELLDAAPEYGGKAELATAEGDNVLQFRGWRRDGTPADTMHNAAVVLVMLGLQCSYNRFHNKLLVAASADGKHHELQAVFGELSDHTIIRLRQIVGSAYRIDFCDKSVRDAVTALALDHCFDPVCDMLDLAQVAWDGVERLDRMAVDYANAEDTPLNRAIMRKTMIAAVRRARRPGCKFDNITVLESEEGWLKSTFWRVLAGDENFSDESILGKNSREVQEHLSEVWIHESADLAGMKRAEVESVKAFASRQVDIARPAYGYFIKRQPRHAINVGTTNSDEYLQSQTGNRRFWPLKVQRPIDVEKLTRDRLQLWGEAAKLESEGESLTLARDLWPAVGEEQEKRRVKDPWENILGNMPIAVYLHQHDRAGDRFIYSAEEAIKVADLSVKIIHDLGDKEFVRSEDLLTHVLRVPIDRQDRHHAMRLADAMKRLGWQRDRVRLGGPKARGFMRLANLGQAVQ
jgi:predicted P-loop ATPase